MPRQLTPEEMKIIRQTEKEGAELAEQLEQEKGSGYVRKQRLKSVIILTLIFILFTLTAYSIIRLVGW